MPDANFKYYDFCVAGMVAVLLCSNLIGPGKVCTLTLPLLGRVSFGAGNLFFPISYIFGDMLTEVYGYARARRAIWAGFGAHAVRDAHVVASWSACRRAPTNRGTPRCSRRWRSSFGNTTGASSLASILAYWVGDFVNSYVLAQDESLPTQRPPPVDAHHRLDRLRPGHRLAAVLPDRLLRHLDATTRCSR